MSSIATDSKERFEMSGLRFIVSSIGGFGFSTALMEHVITPFYESSSTSFTWELMALHILVGVSIFVAIDLLQIASDYPHFGLKWSFSVLIFPALVTLLAFLYSVDDVQEYELFWIGVVASLFITILSFSLAYASYIENKETRIHKEKTEVASEKNEETKQEAIVFTANETLTQSVKSVETLLNEAKQIGGLAIEVVHDLEKMTKQLAESKQVFMTISDERKQEAKTMLQTILQAMESDLREVIATYDEAQLRVFENLILQRTKGGI